MTDLREKLLKAGLVSQEQAQAVASAEAEKARQKQQARGPRAEGGDRPQGRDGGRGGERRDNRGGDRGPRQDGRPDGRRDGPREPRPQNDRPRDNDGKRLSGDEVKRLVELAQKGKIDQKVRGHRRWYFESRKHGLVPCIEVSDEAAQQLENGTWRICETPRGEVWLVDAETARELIAVDPAWIR
jgi:uncharacterized protein YaiL (DUF2058 family)